MGLNMNYLKIETQMVLMSELGVSGKGAQLNVSFQVSDGIKFKGVRD